MGLGTSKHRPGRMALPLIVLVTLVGLVSGLVWVRAGLASEGPPLRDAATCTQSQGLSKRGAEILCASSDADLRASELSVKDATPLSRPDPLDGDPLDGPSRKKRLPDPENASQLVVVQSGRQKDTPNSTVLYDGDAETLWVPSDVHEAWVWLDLGATETVRNVRWLAANDGEVEIAVSRDRLHWAVLATQRVTGDWQEISLREDAQYVRLALLPEDDQSAIALAEVEVYGREPRADVSLAQDAKTDRKKRDTGRSTERAQDAASVDDDAAKGDRPGAVNASTRAGKTKCSGNRERCRARPGKVDVSDDCDGNGSCIIDIRADGGSAVCDASGGEGNETARSEGKRGKDDTDQKDAKRDSANGGRCEAVADGGAVTIGDVNP